MRDGVSRDLRTRERAEAGTRANAGFHDRALARTIEISGDRITFLVRVRSGEVVPDLMGRQHDRLCGNCIADRGKSL